MDPRSVGKTKLMQDCAESWHVLQSDSLQDGLGINGCNAYCAGDWERFSIYNMPDLGRDR